MLPAKRLALLSCRSPFLDDSKIYCPLANLYLASYVRACLPAVEVVVCDDDYDFGDLSWLSEYDAIGISIMTPQRQEALRLTRAIKKCREGTTIVAGGPHVQHYLGDLLSEPSIDYLVPSDGEKALVDILAGAASHRVVSAVLTRQEVAAQPRPDRTSANARAVLARYNYILNGQHSATMMTARGCPERCTFCEDAETRVRRTSLGNIEAELDDIVSLGYGGVYIIDDVFAMSLTTIRPICEALSHRSLVYRCNAQARYFTRWGDQMAELLASSGCVEIAFGAESGSQKILDAVDKRCTVAQNYATVTHAKRHGLRVKAFILIGLPGEDWGTLSETEAFIRDSGIDDFQCAVYMPFRGTRIRAAIDKGESVDLSLEPKGSDGDITGAFIRARGEAAYEVHTAALTSAELRCFREYLLTRYRPASHRSRWSEDKFFDLAAF